MPSAFPRQVRRPRHYARQRGGVTGGRVVRTSIDPSPSGQLMPLEPIANVPRVAGHLVLTRAPMWATSAVEPDGDAPLAALPLRELATTYRLVRRDLSASVIPGMLTTMTAALYSHAGWAAFAEALAKSFVYFFLFIYIFCLSNQLEGIREDLIDKPDRPLPSGRWSMAGAKLRLLGGLVLFVVAAVVMGGFQLAAWAVAWQVVFVVYNHCGLHKHWFTKNVVFIGLGTVVLLGAAWQLVATPDALAWRMILYVSTVFALTLHLQDLRDVAGDRATGRRTLPLAVGDTAARWLLAIGIGVMPLATHLAYTRHLPDTATRVAGELVLASLNLVVAYRTLALRTPTHDHRTYMIHTYWFCAIVGMSGFMM